MWQGEDDMEIGHAQHFLLAPRQPSLPGLGLTLGTMAIAAGVVGEGLVVAAGTSIEVTAERGGTAATDSPQHTELLIAEPGTVVFEEAVTLGVNQIGHFQGRPAHAGFCSLREHASWVGLDTVICSSGLGAARRCVCDRWR